MAIPDNLKRITDSLTFETARAGRPAGSVALVAVSKTRSRDEVEQVIVEGHFRFGENRVQEALDKFVGLAPPAEIHLIGHLQGNKAGQAAGRFALIHSVDSLKLVRRLSGICGEKGMVQKILLQVNTSGESSKSGFLSLEGLLEAMEEIKDLPGLKVLGLMTMGPLVDDMTAVARSFALCREWHSRLCKDFPYAVGPELSMGMSSDYPVAIREGSTLVRIGTSLFGERS
jgi:pyridoxal phosphate enzyme (YggS family)